MCQPPAPDPTPLATAASRPSADDFWTRWLAERRYFLSMSSRWLRGHRQDAEDVLSRAALRAFAYLRNHPGGVEKFRPWALRILHNLCVDTIEDAQRTLAVTDDEDDDETPKIECRVALPDRVVYGGELRVALSDAVGELPPRLAAAFQLRCVDGVGYDEISRLLSITQANARKRVQQARAYLSGRLAHVA